MKSGGGKEGRQRNICAVETSSFFLKNVLDEGIMKWIDTFDYGIQKKGNETHFSSSILSLHCVARNSRTPFEIPPFAAGSFAKISR